MILRKGENNIYRISRRDSTLTFNEFIVTKFSMVCRTDYCIYIDDIIVICSDENAAIKMFNEIHNFMSGTREDKLKRILNN